MTEQTWILRFWHEGDDYGALPFEEREERFRSRSQVQARVQELSNGTGLFVTAIEKERAETIDRAMRALGGSRND